MKYKLSAVFLVAVFALALTAGVGAALRESEIEPEIEASLTYDPVTAHADIIDMDGLRRIEIYFRYREEGEEEWRETEKKVMEEEGKYSKVLDDVDLEKTYEFEVVAEYLEDEVRTFTTEPGPAEFEFSNLRAEPEKVYVDEHTELKLDVENVGGRTGEAMVNFTVKDTVISEEVEVDAGETETASVKYVTEELGEYKVEAAGFEANFEAVDFPSVEPWEARDVTHDSAVLVAVLTDMALEDSVYVYFQYRAEGEDWKTTEKRSMESEGEFSEKVEGLDPEVSYIFMAVVEWDGKRRIEEKEIIDARKIEVGPKAYTDERMRGVTDIGVFFWGSGASLDSEIVEYRWDFYGDGEWDYVSNETGKTIYVYNETGVYDAVFEVEDGKGEVDRRTMEVEVSVRRQPLYEIDEEAEGLGRDVYFGTEYWYDEGINETSVAINVKNTANESRYVSVTLDVPKDVAPHIEDMKTFPGPTEVLEENPKAAWEFTLGPEETGRIEIAFDGHVPVEEFDEMKMVQAYETEEDVRVRTVTGLIIRGLQRIWGFIAIIIIAVVAVLLLTRGSPKRFSENLAEKLKPPEEDDDDEAGKTSKKDKKEKSEKKKTKEDLDQKFIETTRRVKKALKNDEVTDPYRAVDNLERANEALENGNLERFHQHLNQVESDISYGVFSRNYVA